VWAIERQDWICITCWRELWQQHRAVIEAEWQKRFKSAEELRAQREWACRSYSSRLDYIFKLEIQREELVRDGRTAGIENSD
jgi:hypothetical protein